MNECRNHATLTLLLAQLACLQLQNDILWEQSLRLQRHSDLSTEERLRLFFETVTTSAYLPRVNAEENVSIDHDFFCLAALCFSLCFSTDKVQNFSEKISGPIFFLKVCCVMKDQHLAKSIFVAAATIFVMLVSAAVYHNFKNFLVIEKKIADGETNEPTDKAISCASPYSTHIISDDIYSSTLHHFVPISNLFKCFSLTLCGVLEKLMKFASSSANASFFDFQHVFVQKMKQDCDDSLSLALNDSSTHDTTQMVLAAYQVAGFASMASITLVASALLNSENFHVLILSCFLLNEENQNELDMFHSWNNEVVATKRKLLISFFTGEKFFC